MVEAFIIAICLKFYFSLNKDADINPEDRMTDRTVYLLLVFRSAFRHVTRQVYSSELVRYAAS